MEKLKNLAVHWQLLILVTVAALLYTAFWYTVTSPVRVQTAEVETQVASLRQKNEAARIIVQRIGEFRTLYAAKTAEYDELKVLLPEQREITNVLAGLQDTARNSRLSLLRFSPKDDAQQGFITAKAVEVEVSSNFNTLRDFYEKMARLPRIVSISDFNLNQTQNKNAGPNTIDARFVLTAYYASPESQQTVVPPGAKPGTPGAAVPPPAAPPASTPAR